MSKYGHKTVDWFEEIVDKIGGEKQVERLLNNELVIVEKKRHYSDTTFNLTSN